MTDPSRELADKLNTFMKKRYGSASPAMQKRLFDDYDVDQDGTIKKEELSHLLQDAGVGSFLTRSAWVDGVMDKMDTKGGGDGISWAEYESALNDAMKAK